MLTTLNAYQLPPASDFSDIKAFITDYRKILSLELPEYRDELQRLYHKRNAYSLTDEELINLFRVFQQAALEKELKASTNKAELSAVKTRYGKELVDYYWQNVFSDETKQQIKQIATK